MYFNLLFWPRKIKSSKLLIFSPNAKLQFVELMILLNSSLFDSAEIGSSIQEKL